MCQLLIENCHIIENKITRDGGSGGAVYVNQGTVIMNNNTFDGNIANRTAGAVALGGATGKARCNIFKNNSAGKEGGAVYVSNDVLVSEHNTWVANKAEESGGAVFVYAANVNANSDTFAGNQATSGNDFYVFQGSLTACGISSMSDVYASNDNTIYKQLCVA